MNADRTYYVLDRLLSHVLETKAELIAYLIVHDAGNHDPAGVGQRLQARRHIDAVSENVIAVENDVADIDADAEFDALVRRCRGVALCHAALDIDRATDGIDHAHELHEHSIARRFDDSAAMFGDLGIDEFRSELRSAMPRWISTAQRTASTTLTNSTSIPSPVVLTIRPRCSVILGSTSSLRCAFSCRRVPSSSTPI